MPEDVMLQEAVEAIRQGQRGRARDLLTRLLRADSSNAQYWLWMSSVVETPKEQIYCLQSILKVDPNNKAAKQGLVLLGAMPPETDIKPVPPGRRRWQVDVQEIKDVSGLRAVLANPFVRLIVLAFTAFVVVTLVGLGFYYQGQRRKPLVAVIPTSTPGPSPTFTSTPTAINENLRTPTAPPTRSGPPPLEERLSATYTATAVYVNTPHTSNEAFRFAQSAYKRGDFNSAIAYLGQARQVSPDAPDIPYLLGEIYRQQSNYSQAQEAYQAALAINPTFAPAELGLALVQLAQNPKTDITAALSRAIEHDPNLKDAPLELASYLLAHDNPQKALDVLNQAATLLADSPLFYLRRAGAELALGKGSEAYEDALKANQLDQTLLESYRLLAHTAARTHHPDQALEAVKVYLTYEQKDPEAWLIQGMALYGQGEFDQALESLNKSLELDKKVPETLLYHGLVLMELGKGQLAVNEIYNALQSNPRSFDLNLYFSRALLSAGRLGDALGQVNRAYDFANGDEELAQALYWRAQIYEAIGNMPAAVRDWKRVVAMPTGIVPQEQLDTAQAHIETTSTPMPTATQTPVPSRTPRSGAGTPSPEPSTTATGSAKTGLPTISPTASPAP